MAANAHPDTSRIRVGIGGWTYPPWRGTFFPPGLPHKQELAHASRQLSAIEANGTYYRTLPANCVTIYRGAIVYYQCGSVWYRPSYYGTSVQYVVVTAP